MLMSQESQPSQTVMRARPKPWEQPSPLDSPNHSIFNSAPVFQPHPQTQPQTQGLAQGQISPTILQYQQRSSYSSSTNSPTLYNQGGSSRNSHDAVYNSTTTSNWSASGPTISPDLSFEAFNLDPDFASLQSGPSSGLTTNTGSVGTPFDDASFSNYLNVDYSPLPSDPNSNPTVNTYTNQNPINLAPPIPSPGVSQQPNPAPAPENVLQQGWTTGDTSGHGF
jgi:hypothetical protein